MGKSNSTPLHSENVFVFSKQANKQFILRITLVNALVSLSLITPLYTDLLQGRLSPSNFHYHFTYSEDNDLLDSLNSSKTYTRTQNIFLFLLFSVIKEQ